MKKTKLLMPLTGIAAIGAIAPVAVLTSCKKAEDTKANFIKDIAIGNVIDETAETITERLGAESLYAADGATALSHPNFTMSATVADDFVLTNYVKMTIKAQGEPGKVLKIGTPIENKIVDAKEAETKGVWYHTYTQDSGKTSFIDIDATALNKLKTAGGQEEFKFTVNFELFDKNDKSIGKQDKEYKIVICPSQHDLPKLGTWVPAGKQDTAGGDNVSIGIPAFLSGTAGAELTTKWVTPVNFTDGETTPKTLKIAAQTGKIASGAAVLTDKIKATVEGLGTLTASKNFTITAATNVVVEFTEVVPTGGKQYYVIPTWSKTQVLAATQKITVDPAA